MKLVALCTMLLVGCLAQTAPSCPTPNSFTWLTGDCGVIGRLDQFSGCVDTSAACSMAVTCTDSGTVVNFSGAGPVTVTVLVNNKPLCSGTYSAQ